MFRPGPALRRARLLAGSLLIASLSAAPLARAEQAAFFVAGPQQLGLVLGYGHGVDFARSGVIEGFRVRELVVAPHWQIDLTREPLQPAWYKGRVALRSEATLLVNFAPRLGVAGGLGLLLRYRLAPQGRLTPFVEAGAGVLGLDLDLADQADGLAFMPQGGVGAEWALGERLSLSGAVRFHHISNAYTRRPNGGIDSLHFLIGLAWRPD